MKPIPDYGDHLELKEFLEWLDSGSIGPEDGSAYYATVDKYTHISVDLFEIWSSKLQEDLKELGLTHVMWFNK